MRVTVDTNVLIRAVVRDHPAQSRAADALLREAELIAVPIACLCEFVWVLRRLYGFDRERIVLAIEVLAAAGNVVVDRPAVEAGLAMLGANGDFADGVIAHEGRWLGGDTFVSFDKVAISLLAGRGDKARLLA